MSQSDEGDPRMLVPNLCARMACIMGIYLHTNLSMLKEANTHNNVLPSQKFNPKKSFCVQRTLENSV